MIDLAKAYSYLRYIYAKAVLPREVDEFEDVDYTQEELELWQSWEEGDSSMKLLIKINVKETPQSLLIRCKTAREMWMTLQQ